MSSSPSPSFSPQPAPTNGGGVPIPSGSVTTHSGITPNETMSPTGPTATPGSVVDTFPRLIQFGNKTAKLEQELDDTRSRLHALFPFLPSTSKGLVVPAVCRVSRFGEELLDPCPLPSKQVWDEYQECKRAKCASGGDEIDAEECSIAECSDLYIAASSTLCLSLTAYSLRRSNMYLPFLPPHANGSADWQSLHKQHLDFVLSSNQPNVSLFAPHDQHSVHLGVCVPTAPVSTSCDPTQDPTSGLYNIVGSPWLLPVPQHASPSPPHRLPPTNGQPIFPRAMLAFHSKASPTPPPSSIPIHMPLKHPPVMLRTVPLFHANISWDAQALGGPRTRVGTYLSSHNVYSLVYCARKPLGMYLPTRAQGDKCVLHMDCRQNACVQGTCAKGRARATAGSMHQAMAEYVGSDANKWIVKSSAAGGEPAGTRKTSAFPFVLGAVILMVYVIMMYRKKMIAWWVKSGHKVLGTARTTVLRELALAPASNLMLHELGEGRSGRAGEGREEVGGQGGDEVVVWDDGGWVIVGGETLPRYQAGSMDRADQGEAAGHPPAFSTVDRTTGGMAGGHVATWPHGASPSVAAPGAVPEVEEDVAMEVGDVHLSRVEQPEREHR